MKYKRLISFLICVCLVFCMMASAVVDVDAYALPLMEGIRQAVGAFLLANGVRVSDSDNMDQLAMDFYYTCGDDVKDYFGSISEETNYQIPSDVWEYLKADFNNYFKNLDDSYINEGMAFNIARLPFLTGVNDADLETLSVLKVLEYVPPHVEIHYSKIPITIDMEPCYSLDSALYVELLNRNTGIKLKVMIKTPKDIQGTSFVSYKILSPRIIK